MYPIGGEEISVSTEVIIHQNTDVLEIYDYGLMK